MTLALLAMHATLQKPFYIVAVDAKNAVTGVASKAAAGAQRMAGLEPRQGPELLLLSYCLLVSRPDHCLAVWQTALPYG